tara:strand:+ start:1914 stop:2741 length:828 start_codon:yes stop_codon:yes gene_type:complete
MGLTTSNKNNNTAATNEMKNNSRVIAFQDKLKSQTEDRLKRNNRLICGVWGEPKTVKSGIALDFPSKQVYVLDWDDGCEPTWRQNHECTDRITLWNPEIRNHNGELDIQKSEANSEDFVLHVKSKIEEGEDVLFVFDGVDKWLDCCTLHVTGSSKIGKPQKMKFEWGKRNAPFYSLLMMCKNLNCDQIYITHSKADYGATGEVIGSKPNWHNWGDYLHQIITTKRTVKKGDVVYKAELLSSKTNTSLVGTTWETLGISKGTVKWTGVSELKEGLI